MPVAITSASAGPNGASVVAGSASVQGQGTASVVVNQTSQNAVINWSTFNIGAKESTTINMPGATSTELDRVTGGQGPSQILGSLNSNGKVFLVNPDGILFGKGAQVNTGSFLATTHDIANSDFMAGRYNFNGPGNLTASIVNNGSITAQTGGFAALVAPGVRNSGTISARLGTVALASGNAFTLDFYGDNLITLGLKDSIASQVIDVSTGRPLKSLVSNQGVLKANGGRVEMTAVAARAVVDSVINNSGVIEANTIGTHNGMIVLGAATGASKPAGAPTQTVSVSGKLSAAGKRKGTTGGTIVVTGENVRLTGASVNANGRDGGGAVLIGGDWGGGMPNKSLVSNPSAYLESFAVPTASTTFVDAGTTINASATNARNGGKVILWSNEATTFYGVIQARGGQQSGNGGFVETSGHELTFNGSVNTGAANGTKGTLLLDPLDATIATVAGNQIITVASIENALATGDVVVTTVGTSGSQAGNITVASSLSWANANTLTLNAYRDIDINNGVTIANTGAGNLVLRADATGTGVGTVNFSGTGKVDFSGSTGTVSILYNPADNPVGSVVNGTSYTSPFNYTPYVITNGGVTNQLTAYMLVNSVYDLQNMQNNLSGDYALGKNIDASATAGWNGGAGFIPIGTDAAQFQGVFDGQGQTVDRLSINYSSTPGILNYAGLFGYVGANGVAKNVGLTNVSVLASVTDTEVGALAGENWGSIANAFVSGSVQSAGPATGAGLGTGQGHFAVGGLVGLNTGSISSSHSSATVNATHNFTGSMTGDIGGLVGTNSVGSSASGVIFNGSISNSFATGNVTGTISSPSSTQFTFGGLVGQNIGGPIAGHPATATISQSFATGSVSGVGATVTSSGGLAGVNTSVVVASYATGNVGTVSGLSSIAGLIGQNSGGSVSQSYSIGSIGSGGFAVGGLIAYNTASVNSSYWNTQTSGKSTSAGGIGLTTFQLQTSLPSGFSSSVWGSNASLNNGYPYLLWTQMAWSPTSPTVLTPTSGTPPAPTPPPGPAPNPTPTIPPSTTAQLNQTLNYVSTLSNTSAKVSSQSTSQPTGNALLLNALNNLLSGIPGASAQSIAILIQNGMTDALHGLLTQSQINSLTNDFINNLKSVNTNLSGASVGFVETIVSNALKSAVQSQMQSNGYSEYIIQPAVFTVALVVENAFAVANPSTERFGGPAGAALFATIQTTATELVQLGHAGVGFTTDMQAVQASFAQLNQSVQQLYQLAKQDQQKGNVQASERMLKLAISTQTTINNLRQQYTVLGVSVLDNPALGLLGVLAQ